MPMPSKFELMLPLLKLVAERDISMKDAAARLAQDFNLTPAERAETQLSLEAPDGLRPKRDLRPNGMALYNAAAADVRYAARELDVPVALTIVSGDSALNDFLGNWHGPRHHSFRVILARTAAFVESEWQKEARSPKVEDPAVRIRSRGVLCATGAHIT